MSVTRVIPRVLAGALALRLLAALDRASRARGLRRRRREASRG